MRMLFLLLLVTGFCAAEILFEDDFDDGDADGWLEVFPEPLYEVSEYLRYEMSFDGAENIDAVSVSSDCFPLQMSTPDYSVLVQVLAHDPCHEMAACVRVDVSGSDATGYLAMLRFDIGQLLILRYDGTPEWIVLETADLFLEYEQSYWLRFECVGDSLLAKAWQGAIEDEPDEWLASTADQTYTCPGYFGLLAAAYGGGPYDGEFDEVLVTTPVLGISPATWASIKAAGLDSGGRPQSY